MSGTVLFRELENSFHDGSEDCDFARSNITTWKKARL